MLDINNNWDFRSESDKELSCRFETDGFVVSSANQSFLASMREKVKSTFDLFCDINSLVSDNYPDLQDAHKVVKGQLSNDLRLFIINQLSRDKSFNFSYYLSCKEIVDQLCGNELAMQKELVYPFNSRQILEMYCLFMLTHGMVFLLLI